MQFPLVLAVLAYVAGTNAAISFGHQYRNGKVNYHVAWTEGLSPCSNDVVIDLDNGNPCGKDFSLDGTTCTYSHPSLARVLRRSLYIPLCGHSPWGKIRLQKQN
jgi:hypothetical protein